MGEYVGTIIGVIRGATGSLDQRCYSPEKAINMSIGPKSIPIYNQSFAFGFRL